MSLRRQRAPLVLLANDYHGGPRVRCRRSRFRQLRGEGLGSWRSDSPAVSGVGLGTDLYHVVPQVLLVDPGAEADEDHYPYVIVGRQSVGEAWLSPQKLR